MRTPRRLTAIGFLGVLLSGCFGSGASPSASPSSTAGEPSSAPSSAAPSESQTPRSESPASEAPDPTDDLGAFTCDLPIHEDATVARANIADIRVGTHDGYDRVVFEFIGGLPEASLERALPPFTQDASGEPIDVEGSSFLRLIMRGGTRQMDDGSSSYDGPTDFDSGFPALVEVALGGDFEGQSTYYFGLAAESCVRVFTITGDGAPRLVIDIEHPA
jgi:hypothetical protein